MATTEERVRELIARSGRSHGDFAAMVGLDASKLSKSLSGVRRFSSLDLARIAEASGESVDWLLGAERPATALAARAAAGTATEVALREAERLLTLRADLASLGRRQALNLPDVPDRTGNWVADGEALAAAAFDHVARRAGAVTDGDLPSLVERAFGIDVVVRDLDVSFDGLAASTADAWIILLGPTTAPFRPRFTCAHELGHLLGADDQGLHVDEDIDRARTGESEVRANAFAAAFLMPENDVREVVSRGLNHEAFCAGAMRFRVSPSALAVRLERLRLIDGLTKARWAATSAKDAASLAGVPDVLADATAAASSTRPPGLLLRDAFAAYEAGETTLRPYASLLGADLEKLRASLEGIES